VKENTGEGDQRPEADEAANKFRNEVVDLKVYLNPKASNTEDYSIKLL